MVMPLRDDDSDRHTVPVVTYALIAVNVLVWLIELSMGEPFIKVFSDTGVHVASVSQEVLLRRRR